MIDIDERPPTPIAPDAPPECGICGDYTVGGIECHEVCVTELRRLLGYLWHATGMRGEQLAVRDLFRPDDPMVADVERLAIFPEWAPEPQP